MLSIYVSVSFNLIVSKSNTFITETALLLVLKKISPVKHFKGFGEHFVLPFLLQNGNCSEIYQSIRIQNI